MSNVLWYEQKKLFTNTAALRHTNLFYRLLKRPNSTEECWLILSRHQEKGKKICVFKTIISIGKKYSGLAFLLEQRILKLYKHVFFVVFHTFFGSFVYFFFKFLFKHKFNAHNLQPNRMKLWRFVLFDVFLVILLRTVYIEIWSYLCWLEKISW